MSLEVLSATLGLPQNYLRRLAVQGEIPSLDVNGRRRFDEQRVRDALARLAERAAQGSEVSKK